MVAIHSNSDSSGEIWEIALVLLAAANVTHLVKFINKPISPPRPPQAWQGLRWRRSSRCTCEPGESWSNRGLF